MTATPGNGAGGGSACDGVEGVDVGVFEQGSSATDSLQRTGQALSGPDFQWVGPVNATPNFINNDQTFGDPEPTPEPTPAPEAFLFTKAVLVGDVPTSFYDRDGDYPTWRDADGDCISDRHEVLQAQHIDDDASNPLVFSSTGCSVITGKWQDPFDGSFYYSASDIQIDHVVALYESHLSGAGATSGDVWTSQERLSYANTGNRVEGTLPETTHQFLAVGGATNGPKGSSDPTEWMPPLPEYHCTYLKKWVEVKHINQLYFDQDEYDFIKSEEAGCDDSTLPILPANDDSSGPQPGDKAPTNSAVFINEIHYDNEGSDSGEYVEIAGPAGTDLSGYELWFHNGGSADAQYAFTALSGVIPDQSNGYGVIGIDYDTNGLQNGGWEGDDPTGTSSPDSISLSDPSDNCLELISYEGVMSPATGPCSEFESNDIGVREDGRTAQIGESLQKSGTGTISSDFTWNEPVADTKDAVNTNQTFGSATSTTFVVTASGLDYLVDGVLHASITVKRGETYTFDVSDFTSAHPFRLSTTNDGAWNGGANYDQGVTFVSSDIITWTVPETLSASTMYYWCTLHPEMAGSGVINITD